MRPFSPRRLVWRTTPAGHPECQKRNQTLTSPAEAVSSLLRLDDQPEYGWALFDAFDAVARKLLEPLGVSFLDVVPMTQLRPDAHTQARFHISGSWKLTRPDCMHLALPGVPDEWNALLLSRLDACLHHTPHKSNSTDGCSDGVLTPLDRPLDTPLLLASPPAPPIPGGRHAHAHRHPTRLNNPANGGTTQVPAPL